ncbi:benzyl alcohol O-benzoyltransferase-like [Magnolia sinica]|uniref:benzyl alcohol O-benzoyltransferase-like n=1 Tax=Magnolia sinica TaxID=86752 RepID=UPI002659D6A1|nr:benzyl alcohol O-benzoyltransferase-like [Magnolia sinica]
MASSMPVWSITRCKSVAVPPAKPTPHEFKNLSDHDSSEFLQMQVPFIHLYHCNPFMGGQNPAQVIRDAVAKALVFYYPFAGRLRKLPDEKLMVECTGEGVLFIEADAEFRIEQLGGAPKPPFPCMKELLYDIPGSTGIFDCPLVLIQVTRLACGGFILATRVNHMICDLTGYMQFMTAMAEIARGALAPSIRPIWQRDQLFNSSDPSCSSHQFDNEADLPIQLGHMEEQIFFFGPSEISALRKHVPPCFHPCSRFDLLTSCLWRCRTVALGVEPDKEVRLICMVNARAKCNPPLPAGYYGNVLAFSMVGTTAGKLCENPLEYTVELVKKAKAQVTAEYMQSAAVVRMGKPGLPSASVYCVSDFTRAELRDFDFGWGKAVFGGPAFGIMDHIMRLGSIYTRFRSSQGEDGVVVPVRLPVRAMKRFSAELKSMTTDPMHRSYIKSAI